MSHIKSFFILLVHYLFSSSQYVPLNILHLSQSGKEAAEHIAKKKIDSVQVK
jgi:hypothetical protein